MSKIEWYVKKRSPVGMMKWDGTGEAQAALLTWTRASEEGMPLHAFHVDVDGNASVYDRLHGSWGRVEVGDYICQGIQGEFYPIKADVLKETYDRIADQ
jgi:predicted GNAT superfamily acetyltransferase